MNTEKKSYGMALAIWFFTCWCGGHRVYIKESPFTLIWYPFVFFFGLTIIAWYDLAVMKRMIETKQIEDYTRKEMIKNS